MPITKLHKEPIDISRCVTIKEAARILGKNFSEPSIRRRIESGEWKKGVHWINVGVGKVKPVYRINIEKVKNSQG